MTGRPYRPGQPLSAAHPASLRLRLRGVRRQAALTDTTTALLAGGTVIAAAAAFVAEMHGVLAQGVWVWGLVAGLAVTAMKVTVDMVDHSDDADSLRALLVSDFGPDLSGDAETARQARLAIEMRVRLERTAAGSGQMGLLDATDAWLAVIVRLAGQVARLKGEARFQSGLAVRGRSRLGDLTAQSDGSTDPGMARRLTDTARALTTQIAAQEAFVGFVDDAQARLERAVSGFGAVCSQLALVLARGDTETGPLSQAIAQGITALEAELSALAQHPAPGLPQTELVVPPLDLSRTTLTAVAVLPSVAQPLGALLPPAPLAPADLSPADVPSAPKHAPGDPTA